MVKPPLFIFWWYESGGKLLGGKRKKVGEIFWRNGTNFSSILDMPVICCGNFDRLPKSHIFNLRFLFLKFNTFQRFSHIVTYVKYVRNLLQFDKKWFCILLLQETSSIMIAPSSTSLMSVVMSSSSALVSNDTMSEMVVIPTSSMTEMLSENTTMSELPSEITSSMSAIISSEQQVIIKVFQNPSRHMTLYGRWMDVITLRWRRINVVSTSFWRRVDGIVFQMHGKQLWRRAKIEFGVFQQLILVSLSYTVACIWK